MSITIARKILDQVKDGSHEYSAYIISEALKATGDITEIYTGATDKLRENCYPAEANQ